MKYLITGRAGSGKSAVNTELQNRNLNTLDSDKVPGLARWEDLATGERIAVDPSGFVDYQKVAWNWNEKVLKGLLAARKTLFLCGSASNELDFHPMFDKVFVLTVDPQTQLHRLESRESSYGKNPRMQEEIIGEQAEFVEQAVQLGAVAIDNTRPIRAVVDEILEITGE
jgi:dephospho-CoA kinase